MPCVFFTHKGKPLEYIYELGYHIPTGNLCRILHRSINHNKIEPNCIRVNKYREKNKRFWYTPLDDSGNLKPEYWSIYRAQDLDRIHKVRQNDP